MPCLVLSNHSRIRKKIARLLPSTAITAASPVYAAQLLNESAYKCVFLEIEPSQISQISEICGFKGDLPPSPLVAVLNRCEGDVVTEALRHGVQDCISTDALTAEQLAAAVAKARELHAYRKSRLKAEEALQQVRKMEAIGRLTSGVAHDFNNLLTVVMGNIHLLRRRYVNGVENYDPEDVIGKIDAIEKVSQKGAELVRRLMVFTRQTPLTQEVVTVNGCISETFELLKRTLGDSIEMEMILSNESWDVMLDPLEFENMLINFAVNARDAMPRGGKLTIETNNIRIGGGNAMRHPDMEAGAYIMVVISDTGIGMTQDVKANIFEPFFSTKQPGEGTGLGMSMAYGFIKQCGGYVHVYSEVGNGTVFRIYLPKFAADNAVESNAPVRGFDTQGRSILVVDDDEVMRSIAASILQSLGYKTLEAEDGRTALEIVKSSSSSIDLLLSDIHMPGDFDGIKLAKFIRQRFPNIKVLLTSGYSENATPAYILGSGETVVSKPYAREILHEKIVQVFEGDDHARQLQTSACH